MASELDQLIERLEAQRRAGACCVLKQHELELLREKVFNANPAALYWIGRHHLDAEGDALGWEYIEKAAELGHAGALCAIGNRHFWLHEGRSGVPDVSLFYWRRAAELGDYEAMIMIAAFTASDASEQDRLLRSAAQAGYSRAFEILGDLHYSGNNRSRNYHVAYHYYCKAFESAAEPWLIATKLAIMCFEGQGVEVSLTIGLSFLDTAIASRRDRLNEGEDDLRYAMADMYYAIGRAYLGGSVLGQSLRSALIKSAFWILRSAEIGSELARMYLEALIREVSEASIVAGLSRERCRTTLDADELSRVSAAVSSSSTDPIVKEVGDCLSRLLSIEAESGQGSMTPGLGEV